VALAQFAAAVEEGEERAGHALLHGDCGSSVFGWRQSASVDSLIRATYEQVLPLIGSLDLTLVQVQGEVVYVNFRARSGGRDDLVGTDTFVIRDGLIRVHTFYATTEGPTAGDRS
jgi:hypothetical protein